MHNVHLIRDLQRVIDNLKSQWATFLIALLVETNNARKKKKEAGEKGFTAAFLRDFFEQFSRILSAALLENADAGDVYYAHEEQILIKRILEYQNEYLLWVIDFDVPFSNNLSERSLRDLKSKMKISGQFNNIETAGYYADIKSYVETCYRNDVNGFYALHQLCMGTPITLTKLLQVPHRGCE
ncbi:hypothetical protein FACS1894200_01280 [Spirochaetia bacterium]|nr:hypothetical protein FACS1894200_01280 [Spirochaetia bacterium]